MTGEKHSARLEPDEVVSATYYPNKVRLIAAGVSGSLVGLVVGIGFTLVSGDNTVGVIATAAAVAVGTAISLFGSVSNARLRFGSDWVEGPVEGGVGNVVLWRDDVAAMEIVDPEKLRLVRRDGERLLVDLDHYDFMDQQMIRMRLTSLGGGRTSTPAEALVQEPRGHRLGFRRKDDRSGEDRGSSTGSDGAR
ncbi:MAG TPA: hypothetical protein VJ883_11860 [Woeseiaceae bacterium]|nr:hypothetical protein [Woeseiaceae bacterium]